MRWAGMLLHGYLFMLRILSVIGHSKNSQHLLLILEDVGFVFLSCEVLVSAWSNNDMEGTGSWRKTDTLILLLVIVVNVLSHTQSGLAVCEWALTLFY